MIYATYDGSGNLTGAYHQRLSPEHADNYIVLTEAQFKRWTSYRVVNGALELIPAPNTNAEDKAAAITAYKQQSEKLLNKLTRIGFRYVVLNQPGKANDVLVAQQLLIDIETQPSVVAAVTGEETAQALRNEYQQIVAATPNHIKSQL